MTLYLGDLELTGLVRSFLNQVDILDEDLKAGRNNAAFLLAHDMEVKLDKIKERLNRLKYGECESSKPSSGSYSASSS